MNESTKPHSKLGISSCVIGLITFLLFLMAVAVLLNWGGIRKYFGDDVTTYSQLVVLSILIGLFLTIPAHIIGLILGVVPLLSSNRKKLFPLLGVVLNLIFGACGSLPWLLAGYRSS